MKYIFVFLMFFSFVQAQKSYKKLPPAEMIMMEFDNEDDVELIEDFTSFSKDEYEATDIFVERETQSVDVGDFVGGGSFKVALLAPSKVIGSYINSVSNSIISYLIFKDAEFVFEVFDSKDESADALVSKLSEIKAKGYRFVIAPLTKNGAEIISSNSLDLLIFIPTINKNELYETSSNIIFGGIDYKKQLDVLLSFANEKIALFGDGSRLSSDLSQYTKELAYENIVYAKDIKNIKTNLSFIRGNSKLKKSSIFLNMPVVKSSLIASQLTQYKVKPYVLLSTQVNYNPLIFKFTQFRDREFFYIANSISYMNPILKDINFVLGNSPDYNWIDYSSSIGLDYVFASGESRVFDEEFYNNQIDYKVQIKKAGKSSFLKVGARE